MGSSSTEHGRTGSRGRTAIAIVLIAVLVISLGAAVVVLTTRDDDNPAGTQPGTAPVLNLSRTSSTGLAGAAGGTAGYALTGELTQGAEPGVVVDPSGSTATEAQVRELLGALGATSVTVKKVDGGWTATGRAAGQPAAFALDQRAGNLWQYGRGRLAECLSVSPGAQPDDSVSCTAAEPSTTSEPGPGRAAVVAAAKKLFTQVGVSPGEGLKANDDRQGATYLDVPLTVEGLPIVDVTLSVGADDEGIVSAIGVLKPTYATVGRYPLITARQGFDDLQNLPVPAIGQVCDTPDGACPSPTPAKVTAARLAWLTAREGDRTLLVPAWQFEVDGFYGPAVVAVAPQYLATPNEGAPEIDPGSVDTAPPASSDPGIVDGSSGSGEGSSGSAP